MTNKCHIKHKLPADEFINLQIGPIGNKTQIAAREKTCCQKSIICSDTNFSVNFKS